MLARTTACAANYSTSASARTGTNKRRTAGNASFADVSVVFLKIVFHRVNNNNKFPVKNEELDSFGKSPHANPAMVGILVGLGLMFVLICVAFRMFAR